MDNAQSYGHHAEDRVLVLFAGKIVDTECSGRSTAGCGRGGRGRTAQPLSRAWTTVIRRAGLRTPVNNFE